MVSGLNIAHGQIVIRLVEMEHKQEQGAVQIPLHSMEGKIVKAEVLKQYHAIYQIVQVKYLFKMSQLVVSTYSSMCFVYALNNVKDILVKQIKQIYYSILSPTTQYIIYQQQFYRGGGWFRNLY